MSEQPPEREPVYVAVRATVPLGGETPLVYDNTSVTGGLYGWDGSAYQKIGGLV